MRVIDIIAKKRDGLALTDAEIRWFVEAYTRDDIPDYQAAAWAMAVMINGMTKTETTALTLAMAESGDVLDLSGVADYVVDKHSSGGVGDKTSLVVLPLVASLGVPVAKMSGRGLGLSGGTLDKFEAFPGFSSSLSEQQMIDQARSIGIALAGQTRDLAPADGKLYALRDVTATVPSLPLIASSIMSKKIAAGAQGIVLDVKVGSGAFMKDLDAARELAEIMVAIGKNAGRDMVALISDMNQPLGQAVGNALEVREAIDTLNGRGPVYFRDHCLDVAAYMLKLAGRGDRWQDVQATKTQLQVNLENGQGLAKFRDMVAAQGGDVSYVDEPDKLPRGEAQITVSADSAGYVHEVSAEKIALAAFDLGAGRKQKGDPIDQGVGVIVDVAVGDQVTVGDRLATIYANTTQQGESVRGLVEAAILIQDEAREPLPLFYDVIE